MQVIDYILIALYFISSFGVAVYYSKRASKNMDEFFLSGRNLPWYLAGLSMVATTFAADTPLAVTELVAKNGISGNWVWWNFAFGGLLTVFFFARLWRRAGIMTEAEFAEIRYGGKPAKFLRGFRAVYLGLFMNVIIMGWVNSAMIAILTGMFNIPESQVLFYVFLCMGVVAVYSAISGLWGVVITDAYQFIIAMIGCILLSVLVVNSPQIGGMAGLQEKLPDFTFNFLPTISENPATVAGALALSFMAFLAYVGVQWWASWYPGSEPGGGGYVAQRIMSAKDEKHGLLATLFFQAAHYALRPWPWILVGLASLVLYPELGPDEKKMGYIRAMNDFLPPGLKGLLVAAFFAAYMSTISTQLNWGTSYIINDLYKRFLRKGRNERHYVGAARVVTLLLMVVALVVTLFITRISGAWEFIIECGAGLGLVLILRWYWWRVNAWSEISATVTPFLVYPLVKSAGIVFPVSLFYLVGATTLVWVAVTFITKPEKEEVLISFYRKIHPGGRFWAPIAAKVPDVIPDAGMGRLFISWFAGVVLVYCLLFGIGSLVLGRYFNGLLFILTASGAMGVILYTLNRMGWEKVAE